MKYLTDSESYGCFVVKTNSSLLDDGMFTLDLW